MHSHTLNKSDGRDYHLQHKLDKFVFIESSTTEYIDFDFHAPCIGRVDCTNYRLHKEGYSVFWADYFIPYRGPVRLQQSRISPSILFLYRPVVQNAVEFSDWKLQSRWGATAWKSPTLWKLFDLCPGHSSRFFVCVLIIVQKGARSSSMEADTFWEKCNVIEKFSNVSNVKSENMTKYVYDATKYICEIVDYFETLRSFNHESHQRKYI